MTDKLAILGEDATPSAALARALPMLRTLRATADDLARADVLPLATVAERAQASEILRAIVDLCKRGEANRQELLAPYKDVVKQVEGAYRLPLQVLREIEGKLRRRIAEAAEAQDRAEREARRLAYEAELRRQAAPPPETEAQAAQAVERAQRVSNAAIAAVPAPAPKLEGVSIAFRWVVKAFDAALVPERFRRVVLDEAAVAQEIRLATERGAEPAVPGITFERVASTRVTR